MNIWDKLAPYFDTHKNPEEIPTGAADNILIAWPPILEVINSNIDNPKNMNVVDLGCGGGAFCKKLHELGFKVTGIDPSPKMIAVARQNCPKDMQFVIGNSSKLLELNSKDAAITSIMALPFEKELQNTASNILTVLNNNGIVVFAVFNPDFVASCLKINVLFLGFEDQEHPSNGFIDLD